MNNLGDTAFNLSCLNGHDQVLTLLMRQEDTVTNVINKSGCNSFHHACSSKNPLVVKILLDYNEDNKVSLKAKNKQGYTPFQLACSLKLSEITSLFLKMKEEDKNNAVILNKTADFFITCFHVQKDWKLEDFLNNPTETSFDINATDPEKNTGFHLACSRGNAKVVETLLKISDDFNFNLNVTNDNGDTAFHLACTKGHKETLHVLLKNAKDKGLELNSTNKKGETGLDLIRSGGHSTSSLQLEPYMHPIYMPHMQSTFKLK